MEQIANFFKRNVWILYAATAAFICVLDHFFFPADLDFFVSMVMAAILLFDVYRMVSGKRRNRGSTIPYAVIVIIFVNQLYSYEVLTRLIPALSNVAPLWVAIGMICVVLAAMFLWKLLPFLNVREDDAAADAYESDSSPETNASGASAQSRHTGQIKAATGKRTPLRLLPGLLILIVILALTYLVFRFVISLDSTEPFDLISLVTYLVTYGAAIIAVLLAVGITVIVIIELIRFIHSRICVLRISESGQRSPSLPTYVFSCAIVAVLFYLSYRISGFTMDDFADVISGGKYLALPLTVLVLIAAFFVLVHVTHGIILLVSSLHAQDIREFFSRAAKSIKLSDSVATIGKTIVSIVLGTIITALKYVEFIPDFFTSMYFFAFAREDESFDGIDDENSDIA